MLRRGVKFLIRRAHLTVLPSFVGFCHPQVLRVILRRHIARLFFDLETVVKLVEGRTEGTTRILATSVHIN